jgi:hypothetical protein
MIFQLPVFELLLMTVGRGGSAGGGACREEQESGRRMGAYRIDRSGYTAGIRPTLRADNGQQPETVTADDNDVNIAI